MFNKKMLLATAILACSMSSVAMASRFRTSRVCKNWNNFR